MARRGEGSLSTHIYMTTAPVFPIHIYICMPRSSNSKLLNSEAAGDLPRYFEEESERKEGRKEGRPLTFNVVLDLGLI